MNFIQKAELAYRQIKKIGCNVSTLQLIRKIFFCKKNNLICYISKHYKNPIYLRANTSDIAVYDEVILKESYRINTPIEATTILDCGTNIGLSAVFFKNRFPKATIICVEPELSNFEMLLKNVEQYNNVITYHAGIWNKSTYLTVMNDKAEKYAFMVCETETISDNTIRAISITDIMKENHLEVIDILKIDIEGAEKEIFSSDYDYWMSKTKLIVIELHDRMKSGCSKAFFDALTHYNFEIVIREENIFCFMKHICPLPISAITEEKQF